MLRITIYMVVRSADEIFGNHNARSDDDPDNLNDGHDTLIGGAGNDTIVAGDGNDVVEGGTGNDNIRSSEG